MTPRGTSRLTSVRNACSRAVGAMNIQTAFSRMKSNGNPVRRTIVSSGNRSGNNSKRMPG